MEKERDIQTISFGKGCRIRIGMYLSADAREALHLGLREIYINSLDALTETDQSKGTIEIEINSDKREVRIHDNGPGIPIKLRDDGSYSLVAAYTLSHTGSHFANTKGINAIGVNGIGASVVNHTAAYFKVTSSDKKKSACAEFVGTDDGAKLTNYAEAPKMPSTGVTVIYRPDPIIYGDEWFDKDFLINEFSEMMKFYPKYKIEFNMDGSKYTFSYPNGLKEKDTCIYYESDSLIMALNLNGGGIRPYGNRLYLPSGGAFFTYFKTQLTKLVNEISGLKLKGEQIHAVFGGYLAIFVDSPLFSNQSKTAISNKEVNNEIGIALRSELEKFIKTSAWERVIKSLEAEAKAEAAAEKAREKILKAKKEFSGKKINTMSEKFIDTDWKNRRECDLYLVEGDSAGGNIKKKRPETAGLMLLRGKVLNTCRTDFSSVLENKELMMISKGIGATLSDNGFLLTENNLRFDKIIIATDADEDGVAIRSLLLGFFYKYYPQLLRTGHIYSLAPKLFKLQWRNQDYFFGTEKELKQFETKNHINQAKTHVTRYKGLGSYSADEFYTQINPETRDLIQITIKDAKKALQAIKLMENDMTARRQLINGEFTFDKEEEN